jgi:DNA integrity scanning protein DisA with diadenylate cyclase activity
MTRFFSIGTDSMSIWLQTIESAMSLTYEGKDAQYCILVCRQYSETFKRIKDHFVQIQGPADVRELLLGEKWIRTVVDGKRLALLGGRKKTVNGFILIPGLQRAAMLSDAKHPVFAPHDSLLGLQNAMANNDICLIGTEHHDIYVVHESGIAFHKTQGRWSYNNYMHFYRLLQNIASDIVSRDLVRMSLDLSYERKGALLILLDRHAKIDELVRDRKVLNRPNRMLRSSVTGLNITNWNHRHMVTSIAGIDGSIILDHDGGVRDAACILAPDESVLLKKTNVTTLKTFPGARTTAAYKASFFGVAIKISKDGPVSIWRDGEEVYKLQ